MPKKRSWEPDRYYLISASSPEPHFQHVYVEGTFQNTDGQAAVVVARCTVSDGVLKGWIAYIGAYSARNENDAIRWVAEHGNQIPYEWAKAWFNGPTYPKAKYDNGF